MKKIHFSGLTLLIHCCLLELDKLSNLELLENIAEVAGKRHNTNKTNN